MKINLFSPSIPSEKVIDFNVSLWAGLASGIISGITTGIIVGWVIWKAQKREQQNKERQGIEKDFYVFLQDINRTFLLTEAYIISYQGSDYLKKNILEVRNLIRKQPIQYWKEQIKRASFKDVLSKIERFNTFDNQLQQISSHLDTTIQTSLVPSTHQHFMNDYISCVYSIIHKIDNKTLKNSMSTLNLTDQNIETLRELTNKFPNVVNQYKTLHQQLEDAASELKIAIDKTNTPL